jgi:hypothetical protein
MVGMMTNPTADLPSAQRDCLHKLKAMRQSGELRAGQQVHLHHAEWCSIYVQGPCNCDPEVELWPDARGD